MSIGSPAYPQEFWTQGNFDGNLHLKDVALDRIAALFEETDRPRSRIC